MSVRDERPIHYELALETNPLGGTLNRTLTRIPAALIFLTVAVLISAAQDVPDSKDPAGMMNAGAAMDGVCEN